MMTDPQPTPASLPDEITDEMLDVVSGGATPDPLNFTLN